MRIFNKLSTAAVLLTASLFCWVGCKDTQEGDSLARAVAADESVLNFAAKNAAPATFQLYSDGAWQVDAPDWATVSPTSGSGPQEITVTVTDNVTGGVTDTPRTGTLTFRGRSMERQAKVIVNQRGDRYKGIREIPVGAVAELKDSAAAKILSSQVVAVSTEGFVVSDGSSHLVVSGVREVKIGDRVLLNGTKSTANGIPVFLVDEAEVESNASVTYPAAKDVTADAASYAPGVSEYISLDGSLVENELRVAGSKVRVILVGVPAAMGLADVDLHKVLVKGYYAGASKSEGYLILTAFTDKGLDESLIPYPVKFAIGNNLNYTTASFAASSRFDAIQGLGYIQYVPFDLANTDDNKRYLLDVSGSNPRCTGPWPGDYWLFYGRGGVKAGSQVTITFEARTSASGHKFWRLEYLDGEVWKIAGESQTTTETGEEVIFTHAMNADGKTNVQVQTTVTFNKNNEHCQFRFLCVANWQASGAGKLPTRNGGSARLACTDPAVDTYKPSLVITKEGDGVERPDVPPTYANIVVSTDLLTFEGAPAGPSRFTVTSDKDYAISTDAEWLSLDVADGLADERKTVAVTCAPSNLSTLRSGAITVVSADSKKVVHVVQSAAGGELKPLVSVVGGNTKEIGYEAADYTVEVQSNVAITASPDVRWITITSAPATRAMVESRFCGYSVARNDGAAPRTGHIVFKDARSGVESVLTIIQGIYAPLHAEWLFSAEALSAYAAAFGGTAGVADSKSGDGGMYVASNVSGNGRITYVQTDKTAIDVDRKATRIVGGTGHPYVTGAWPGDSWLFKASDGQEYAAGTKLHIHFETRISGTGQKYWMLEYWDGAAWQPAATVRTVTVGEETVRYNFTPSKNSKKNSIVDFTWTLAAPCTDMQFRYRCMANWTAGNAALPAPNGGTCRIAGAEGTSPVFEVVN